MFGPIESLLSSLYGAVINLRHKLFDWGVIESKSYDIPVICVGNLTVGGTGKTPVTELLVDQLSKTHKVAVLSRGYGRRTKGYKDVMVDDSFLDVGDEPKQIKLKFPEIVVAVCEKRRVGIETITAKYPDVDLIILDDGFQHRYVEPKVNIVLMDYSRPIYHDTYLPKGNLRDSLKQLYRANILLVTKCPINMNDLERSLVAKYIHAYPYQKIFFTRMKNLKPKPIWSDVAIKSELKLGDKVLLMSGIGNPKLFEDQMKEQFNVMNHIIYPDHHKYTKRNFAALEEELKKIDDDCMVLITEKDAVKLTNRKAITPYIQSRLFCLPIEVYFMYNNKEELFKKLENDVKTNSKYSL